MRIIGGRKRGKGFAGNNSRHFVMRTVPKFNKKMAMKRKTEDVNLTGFFTAQLQTEKTEIQKVVCFCPEKHETFKGAEIMDKPFQIINAKVQPDGQGTTTIKCFKEATLLSSNRNLGFQKTYKTYKKHLDFEARQEVSRLGNIEEYQMVTVHIKVVSLSETHSEVNTQYGKKDIYSARVADSSDHKSLTIWSKEIYRQLKVDEFYVFTNLRSKMYDAGAVKDIDALGDFLLLNGPFLFVFGGHGNVSKMEHPEVL
ncbi:hypothetical protein DPMN_182738 [Dreissena polymorpha]|uniref:Uncharacterized protein n=1 Tax=Dreissena polymorpha TaxID=45954 RepID=A0A9D4I4V7_DREPO|nr:hypothetical protein DPMN_182738 [Dreissena polymorpha]